MLVFARSKVALLRIQSTFLMLLFGFRYLKIPTVMAFVGYTYCSLAERPNEPWELKNLDLNAIMLSTKLTSGCCSRELKVDNMRYG